MSPFRSLILSLFFAISIPSPLWSQEAETFEEAQKKGTERIQITLIGLTAYSDFQQIRSEVTKREGVRKVVLESEAPGLITFIFLYTGNPQEIIEQLSRIAPDKYSLAQKTSPSGRAEITVTRKAY